MTGVNYCDTEIERNEEIQELENNPDFTFLGYFQNIQDIYHELNEVGFSDNEIEKMSINRYGKCLEIIEYNSHYDTFIGNR